MVRDAITRRDVGVVVLLLLVLWSSLFVEGCNCARRRGRSEFKESAAQPESQSRLKDPEPPSSRLQAASKPPPSRLQARADRPAV